MSKKILILLALLIGITAHPRVAAAEIGNETDEQACRNCAGHFNEATWRPADDCFDKKLFLGLKACMGFCQGPLPDVSARLRKAYEECIRIKYPTSTAQTRNQNQSQSVAP